MRNKQRIIIINQQKHKQDYCLKKKGKFYYTHKSIKEQATKSNLIEILVDELLLSTIAAVLTIATT